MQPSPPAPPTVNFMRRAAAYVELDRIRRLIFHKPNSFAPLELKRALKAGTKGRRSEKWGPLLDVTEKAITPLTAQADEAFKTKAKNAAAAARRAAKVALAGRQAEQDRAPIPDAKRAEQ